MLLPCPATTKRKCTVRHTPRSPSFGTPTANDDCGRIRLSGLCEDSRVSSDDNLWDEPRPSLEDRIRNGPLFQILLWTTLIAGAVWVVSSAAVGVQSVAGYPHGSGIRRALWVWMQVGSSIAYSVFIVGVGSYVLLWLRLRQTSSPDRPGEP